MGPPPLVDRDGFLPYHPDVQTNLAAKVSTVRTVVARLGKESPVVRTVKEPLSWETLENDFVSKVELGRGHEFFDVIPIESITHPLLVFDNLGGSVLEHFVVLPRRKWARFFANNIYSNN